jgi:hypothetical protein
VITITRQFALQLRNLLRRMGLQGRSAHNTAPVVFLASEEGFHIRAVNGTTALEYHHPGPLPPAQFALPVEALADCEGKRDVPVHFEATPDRLIEVRWEDRGIPVVRRYGDCREQVLESWPQRPKKFSTNDHRLVEALQAAAAVVDRIPSPRFALHTIQLQGTSGKIVATDTRQALVIRGEFQFPWEDDVLVVPTDVFGVGEFSTDVPVEVGATDTHVFVRIRPWTLYLARIKDRRYPNVEDACPLRAAVKTRVQIPAEDREFLIKSLRRLPANAEPDSPVTVDCNGHFAIRAQVNGETPRTELVLSRSQVTGEPARFNTNRRYLEHAVSLGLNELLVTDAHAPCVFEDARRTYFWMVLGPEDALGPLKDCVRIESAPAPAIVDQPTSVDISVPVPKPSDERLPPMARITRTNGSQNHEEKPDSNGVTNGETNGQSHTALSPNGTAASAGQNEAGAQDSGAVDPIVAAETLQGDLRTALLSTSRLLQVLRKNRKQARLVESTLQSLRQLQGV